MFDSSISTCVLHGSTTLLCKNTVTTTWKTDNSTFPTYRGNQSLFTHAGSRDSNIRTSLLYLWILENCFGSQEENIFSTVVAAPHQLYKLDSSLIIFHISIKSRMYFKNNFKTKKQHKHLYLLIIRRFWNYRTFE